MEIKRIVLSFSILAVVTCRGVSHAKEISDAVTPGLFENTVEEISSSATRALKSVHKLSKKASGGFAYDAGLYSRRLLQGKSACEWEDGECTPTAEVELEVLSSASSDTAKLVLRIFTCGTKTSEDECTKLGCTWEDGECSVQELFGDANECYGEDFKVFESDEIDEACKADHTDANNCNAALDCTWNPNTEVCGFDYLKVFTGVGSVNERPVGYDEVGHYVVDAYVEWLVAKSNEDGIALSSDKSKILSWQPPPFECPDESKRLSCDAVVDGALDFFRTALYCSEKYSEAEACKSDPLCGVDDDDGSCVASQEVQDRAFEQTTSNFFGNVSNPLFARFLDCSFVTDEARCKDACTWDATEGSCKPEDVGLTKAFGTVAKANPKAECQVLGAVAETGCTAESADTCESNPLCELDEEGDCAPELSILGDLALASDEGLKARFEEASEKCITKGSEQECQ